MLNIKRAYAWLRSAGGRRRTETSQPGKVIDTGADLPRDLDDPFSDPDAQARFARLVAEKALKGPSSGT